MVYKRKIYIEKLNDDESWSDYIQVHANINKTRGSEFLSAGAVQSQRQLTFDVRWNEKIKRISYNLQLFRIYYDGAYYNIVDYDDYRETHRAVRLAGVSYGN